MISPNDADEPRAVRRDVEIVDDGAVGPRDDAAPMSVYGVGMRTSVQMPFRCRMPQSDRSAPIEREVADARVLLQHAAAAVSRIDAHQSR